MDRKGSNTKSETQSQIILLNVLLTGAFLGSNWSVVTPGNVNQVKR